MDFAECFHARKPPLGESFIEHTDTMTWKGAGVNKGKGAGINEAATVRERRGVKILPSSSLPSGRGSGYSIDSKFYQTPHLPSPPLLSTNTSMIASITQLPTSTRV